MTDLEDRKKTTGAKENGAAAGREKEVNLTLRKLVFFPPWLLLIGFVAVCLVNVDAVLAAVEAAASWVMDQFAWAFNLTILGCLATVIVVYFSPLGKVRIGGRKARPTMKFIDLVWITLCTTIASGILLWACAEPLYHYYTPAENMGLEGGTAGSAIFAMETMYLEWTWSPYAMFALAALLFAFVFYNMREPFSIGSSLVPLFGPKVKKFNTLIDLVCVFSMVLGLAACLGIGVETLSGGVEYLTGLEGGALLFLVIIAAVVITFIISSVTGVLRGIRMLSNLNVTLYIILLVFIFLFGPTTFILNFAVESWGTYLSDFMQLSLITGEAFGDSWAKTWPTVFWCSWLAWAPITGVFLGKILKGYTLRDAIMADFVFPSLFSTVWMGVFSSTSLYYEMNGADLYGILLESGEGSVVYAVLDQLPLATLMVVFYLFVVFISFVTAADSTTNVVSGLCTSGLDQDQQESKAWVKIVWGITVGVITWILLSFAGIDGIKQAFDLSGFPMMFLIILMIISLLKVCMNPARYDVHKEDYDAYGRPLPSQRLPVEGSEKRKKRRRASAREGEPGEPAPETPEPGREVPPEPVPEPAVSESAASGPAAAGPLGE